MSRGDGSGLWQTERNLSRLRDEWAKGTSTAEIGRLLRASKSAIVGKAGRLDLPGRPSPIKRGPDHIPVPISERERQRAIPQTTLPPIASEVPAPEVTSRDAPTLPAPISPPPAPRPVIAAPVPPAMPASAFSEDDRTCRWPITERPYRYCDQPTFGRLAFCEKHAGKAYQTEGWRQRANAGPPAHASGGGD
jgi:GcrA cell cycle regulator